MSDEAYIKLLFSDRPDRVLLEGSGQGPDDREHSHDPAESSQPRTPAEPRSIPVRPEQLIRSPLGSGPAGNLDSRVPEGGGRHAGPPRVQVGESPG